MTAVTAGTSKTFTAQVDGSAFVVIAPGGAVGSVIDQNGNTQAIDPNGTRRTFGPLRELQSITVSMQIGNASVELNGWSGGIPITAETNSTGQTVLDDASRAALGRTGCVNHYTRAIARLLAKKPSLNRFIVYGDSYGQGVGATTPTTGGYAYLLDTKYGSNFSGGFVQGAVSSQTTGAYVSPTLNDLKLTENDVLFGIVGLNQVRLYGPSPDVMKDTQLVTEAALAWMALPESNKIRSHDPKNIAANVPNPAVTYSGTWTHTWTPAHATKRFSYSNALNSSATMTVPAGNDTLYLVACKSVSNTNQFTITVDGVVVSTQSAGGAAYNQALNNFDPFLFKVKIDPSASHTVVLTQSTAPGNLMWCEVMFFNSQTIDGPTVLVGNHVNLSATGWAVAATLGSYSSVKANDPASVSAIFGQTWNPQWMYGSGGMQAHHRAIKQACENLANDGLNVVYLDTASEFDPVAHISVDNVHPNDAGHITLSRPFSAFMGGVLGV